jgi:O-antigen biosynthesis protein
VTEGAFAGAWPAADFDEVGYLAEHPEAADTPWSGLEHRLRTHAARPQRSAEAGRWVSAEALFEQLRANARARDPAAYNLPAYEALSAELRAADPELFGGEPADGVRVVAFHRPDLAGGEVWSEVVRALPNYRGHYQPHLPADLGFYAPLDPAVLARQADLAARYGIAGFCHPFPRAAPPLARLADGPADFGFCLMLDEEAQSDPDLAGLAAALAPFLTAPRALRVHGAALLVLAASPQTPDDAERADALRQAVRDAGQGELFLVRCAEFALPAGPDPAEQGFDAAVDFAEAAEVAPIPPPGPVVNHRHQGVVRDYRDLARQAIAAAGPGRLPAVAAGFDDAPCGQDQASVYHHASPGAFQAWLEAALAQAGRRRSGEERLVFVHAWNGWLQGAHLEPDIRFGHGWLEAVKNALDADLLERP